MSYAEKKSKIMRTLARNVKKGFPEWAELLVLHKVHKSQYLRKKANEERFTHNYNRALDDLFEAESIVLAFNNRSKDRLEYLRNNTQ